MKRSAIIGLILLYAVGYWLISHTIQPATVQAAAPEQGRYTATPRPSTATSNPALMAEVTLLFQRATDTQVAIAKTESAILAAQQTQAEAQYLYSVEMTNQADQAQQLWTAIATQTFGAMTAQATQTYGMQTAMATQTYGMMTQMSNATTTALVATQIIENDKLRAARFGVWGLTIFFALLGGIVVVFLAVKIWGIWKQEKAKYLQASSMEPDQNGRRRLVTSDALGKGNKIIDPNLAHRAVIDPERDDLTAEQALANTQSNRNLEATRVIAQSPILMRKIITPKQSSAESEASMPDANVVIRKMGVNYLTDGKNIVTPAWSLFESWDGKDGIPYGISERGLEQVSIQLVPHGGVFGKTGSGKSRGFLRPFIAGAIASGQRVVIIGKEVDFWPFAQHPNVKMIGVRNITQEDEAARYADYLLHIVEEMNRRDEYLTARHVSTWDQAGRENTLIILDELGNALDMMPSQIRQEAHRRVSGVVREGRKYGLNIWLATQRAVGFKSIVEQLGRAVFYLSDAEASRYALGFPGAETLGTGQFFAKFHRTMKCSSFEPTDEELKDFLQGRNVKVHEPITWIEGKVVDGSGQPLAVSKEPEEDMDAKIVRIYKAMKEADRVSLSEIQRQVYGDVNTGGAHFRHVQDVIAQHNQGATTTEKTPDAGLLSSSATPAT